MHHFSAYFLQVCKKILVILRDFSRDQSTFYIWDLLRDHVIKMMLPTLAQKVFFSAQLSVEQNIYCTAHFFVVSKFKLFRSRKLQNLPQKSSTFSHFFLGKNSLCSGQKLCYFMLHVDSLLTIFQTESKRMSQFSQILQ